MARLYWAAALIALTAVPAAAQITTTCNRFGQQTTCTTQPPYDASAPYRQLQDAQRRQEEQNAALQATLQRAVQERRARQQAEADYEAERHAQHEEVMRKQEADNFNANLSQLILAGRCDDAKTFALERNNLAAAEQAMRLCTPK